MRIAVVHGYFLSDSGSGVYVRELAKQFARDGHEVTLVCQEQESLDYLFIDSCYEMKPDNKEMTEVWQREKAFAGSCRIIRPDIKKNLLTYVKSSNTKFNSATFQDAPGAVIEDYLESNITALESVFRRWPPEAVLANHAIMQPYEVRDALVNTAPYCATIHGSALNFSVKTDPRLRPYFLDGMRDAKAIIALSEDSARDVISYSGKLGLDISGHTSVVPPGVDTSLFCPGAGLGPEQDEIVVAGRLLWTKGTHYAVAATPLICQSGKDIHLVLAGDGPMEKPLKAFIELLDQGCIAEARKLTEEEPELKANKEYGPVIPDFGWEEEELYAKAAKANTKDRIKFVGHLAHEQLAPLLAGADIVLMPSVYPEAYGMAVVEGLSSGAVPIASYHSGLKTPLDILEAKIKDPVIKSIIRGVSLTRALADSVVHILDRYPTKDTRFRDRLHALAETRFSWARTAEMYIMLFKE
jgi:glycosyltransferase involved in cell wall biosynthesis